jgi:hypothetical protein
MTLFIGFLMDLGFFHRGTFNSHRGTMSHRDPSWNGGFHRSTMGSDLFPEFCRFA